MPGRIVMESDAAPKTDGPNKTPSANMTLTAAAAASASASASASAPTKVNHVANGHTDGATKEEDEASPPELEHWSHTYSSFGTLLERMAQQCYFELGEVIEQMADLTIASPQTNGASTSAPDVSKASLDKKLRLMNFANTQQARFIKALVLSDWARNVQDMDKLIELRMFLTQQDEASTLVSDAIMQMKHNMIGAKMPNPNIQGALELLSTSKAPWLPDLGYIPPKPLSAQKLLKTLRDMNFVLSVRLNLHERLPPHFCNYSIADGRATFVVPHEFELDLAVTDEDTASPFYFIDIRFLFSDAPPLPDGFARVNLEAKLNQILQLEGLSAAYDFLHGFVLTHKITLLRRQAFELSRTRWTECLHVEPIHRSLVVQYWTGQSGAKSWIEIGIVKGKKAENSDQPHTPATLNIRWFRAGKEVSDTRFDLDPANLSMEHILNQVTAAHMNTRLATTRDQLLAISPPKSALDMNLHSSSTDPNACSLSMKLGQHGLETTLRIIPVNGNISISPVSAASIDVERRLNADPSIDAAQILSYLNCKLVQDHITRQAIRAGWLLMPTDKQHDTNKIFSEQTIRRTTFTSHGWGEDWAIALTISLSGVKWWIVRLTSAPTSRIIHTAETLALPQTTKVFDRHTLMLIESRAVAQVSLSNISSQLRNSKVKHEIRHVVPTASNTSALQASMTTAVIGIKFQDLMQPESATESKAWKPWCHSTMVLTHHGMDESDKQAVKIVHVLKTTLSPQTAEVLAPLVGKGMQNSDIIFGPNGILALQLRTHFGVALLEEVKLKLGRVQRLANVLSALRQRKFKVEKIAISGLVFCYQAEPKLQAAILFAESAATPLQLRFAGDAARNPHRRVLPLLQNLLTPPPGQSSSALEEGKRFDTLLNLMTSTLPILSGICAIESHDPSNKTFTAGIRSLLHFRLSYLAPLPAMTLNIELKRKDAKDIWTVTTISEPGPEKEKALDLLEKSWKGKALEEKGVKGFRSGVVAEIQGVQQVLWNLDQAVRGGGEQGSAQGDKGREVILLD